MSLKLLLVLFAPLLTAACASTQKDFAEMPLTERQGKVCYGSDSFQERKNTIETYENMIAQTQLILMQGYRVHSDCQQVRKQQPSNCGSYSTSMGKTTCEGTSWTRATYETQCTETPVPIDPQHEQNMLDTYSESYKNLNQEHRKRTNQCFARVAEMPPQAAYIYYSEDMEPQ
ncbi:hypothetical protein N9359_02965 [Luminiphilus sp.]|nr:hypothetical protein [Luminiphilus sp.]